MLHVELQLQQPLKKPASSRVGANVIQVIQAAMRAALDGVLVGAAMRAGARRVGVANGSPVPALTTRYVVRLGAPTRTVVATVAEILLVDGAIDE